MIALNTTFFPRWDIIRIPSLSKAGPGLKNLVLQTSEDGKEGYAIMHCPGGGSVGELKHPSSGLHELIKPVSVYTNGSDHFVLRNAGVHMTISKGRISSLIDVKKNRELIPEGMTGGLVIFQDQPNYWDAWDVEIHHLETRLPLEFTNVSVVAQGPLRASVRAEVKYGQSMIAVTISLDATTATVRDSSRSLFNFEAEIDWHQRHEFLKFELPLNINSPYATYETQFGYVQRPTHKNTTWDIAKFEVCGHKFADLSEFGYGVAILSESKYGFSCQGNVLRISLLRAATAPDAEQDQGKHYFSWAVMPHEGHFLESDVPIAGYLYNSPLRLRCIPSGCIDTLSSLKPPFFVEGTRNVFLETIKRGEYDTFDRPANFEDKNFTSTIILRLYEAFGGHAQVKLVVSPHLPVVKAFTTNLLEDEDEELYILRDPDGNVSRCELSFSFRGFEVKTVKLVLGTPPCGQSQKRISKRSSWINVDGTQF
jgi:alpha-mannosidase